MNNTNGRRLFGTDGIRGIANEYPMTLEVAVSVGRALANWLKRKNIQRPKILVGKDTRQSGYLFEMALTSGIISAGGDVLLAGVMPTPAIAYLTSRMHAHAGVMVSASHNPSDYNGIKIFDQDGYKFPDESETEIEKVIHDMNLPEIVVPPEGIGRVKRVPDAAGRYIAYLKESFPRNYSLDGIKIVMDCSNGAAYRVGPMVFDELGATVIPMNIGPNGRNINLNCGTLYPELISKEVLRHKADIGVTFDGDADRVILIDHEGNIVDGDQIMAICAMDMKRKSKLQQDTVVATIMSNIGFERAMNDAGIKVLRANVGDRYVIEMMRKGGYGFGGEQSGHIIFYKYSTTGDGLMGAIQVLRNMVEQHKGLKELAGCMVRHPQVLDAVAVREKISFENLEDVSQVIRAVKDKLGSKGRVLVRYSGTEPLARVMVEGENLEEITRYMKDIVASIQLAIGRHGGRD